MKQPLISVVLTTYNRSNTPYLKKALESVFDQTFTDYELIVVDDGSVETAEAIVKKTAPSAKYIYQKNQGLAAARNTGIKAAQGKYIAFLDDDDIWKKDKLKKQVDFIQNDLKGKKWGVLFTWLEQIDEKDRTIKYVGHDVSGNVYKRLFYENVIDAPSSTIIPKKIIEEVGFLDNKFRNSQDIDLYFRICKKYPVYPIKEFLVKYRIHPERISKKVSNTEQLQLAVFKKALANDPEMQKESKQVFANLYRQKAIDYFMIYNDFTKFRNYLKKANSYKKLAFSPLFISLWLLSFLHPLAKIIIILRKILIRNSVFIFK